jgi:hypothetical protein
MNLLDFIESEDDKSEEATKSLIRRRRLQMLVHSCIYYQLNDNIITDHKWQEWADELQALQEKHPNWLEIGCFDKAFKDWTGATGNHLPLRDPWVMRKSLYLLEMARSKLNASV